MSPPFQALDLLCLQQACSGLAWAAQGVVLGPMQNHLCHMTSCFVLSSPLLDSIYVSLMNASMGLWFIHKGILCIQVPDGQANHGVSYHGNHIPLMLSFHSTEDVLILSGSYRVTGSAPQCDARFEVMNSEEDGTAVSMQATVKQEVPCNVTFLFLLMNREEDCTAV